MAMAALLSAAAMNRAAMAGEACVFKPETPLKFHSDGRWIRDQHGRAAILRGVNVGVCYHRDGMGFTAENLEGLEKYGFNFIRMNLGWDFIEPEKGKRDDARMKMYADYIREAQSHGIYTMPDFHQMMWEAHIPHWMRDETLGHDHLSETSPVAAQQAAKFWSSAEMRGDLISFLAYVAEKFNDTPGLFGYDLFNEPFSIDATSYAIFEKRDLYPFYEQAIPAVRAADPDAPIILEPHPQSVVLPAYMRPFPFDNLIYSPHVYYPHDYGPKGLQIHREETPEDVQRRFKRYEKDAKKMGAPWLVGEYGGDPVSYPFVGPWLLENMKMQEEYLVGSAYWGYSPKGGGGWDINESPARMKPLMESLLVRPYPQYTAGVPVKLSFDEKNKEFLYIYASSADACAPTEIFYPEKLYAAAPPAVSAPPGCKVTTDYNAARGIFSITAPCAGEIKVIGSRKK